MARRVENHPVFGCVLWARKPYLGRLGTYVAVRLRHGRLAVAIRHPGWIEWVPADKALSEREAQGWARSGF
jgi:hypothetical protein